jgi:hypothetical protein
MTSTRLLSAFRLFLLLPLLATTHVHAALITYTTQSLGGSLYRYDYTITHQAGEDPLHLVDIEFDPALYLESSLNIVSDPALTAGWDQIIIGSQPGLPALFDLLALGGPLDGGASLSGFAIEFEWLGAGVPGPQAFQVVNPDTFTTVSTGRTNAAATVPEPASWMLALTGLALALAFRPRSCR